MGNDDVSKYREAIQKALNYCKTTDIAALEPGNYPIEGNLIYAKVFDNTSKPLAETHAEYHNDYIDVQFFVTGGELMGYCPKKQDSYELCGQIEEEDVYFLDNPEGEQFIKLVPGDYIMLFPNDLHRPGVCENEPQTYRKAVIKVAVSLLK